MSRIDDRQGGPIDRFAADFSPDVFSTGPSRLWTSNDAVTLLGCEPSLYTDFLREVARTSFGDGLVRFLIPEGVPSLLGWNEKRGWSHSWPQWRDRLTVFAYDWLGRQFAFDRFRLNGSEPMVSILEPGTGELLEVAATFRGFLETELIEFKDAALASEFFKRWRQGGGALPGVKECVGYKIPLFLGGADTIDNLELIDLEVYLSICGQLFSGAIQMEAGQKVAEVGRRL